MGIGAIGSWLCESLLADNHGDYGITVLDFDKIEERNLRGTQRYSLEQIDLFKTESLQYGLYKTLEKEINILTQRLTSENVKLLSNYDLVIDTFDNHASRKLVQDYCTKHEIPVVHCGFSKDMTFAIEFGDNYVPPTDIINAPDICEAEGASSFIKLVASLGSLVIQDFLKNGIKKELVGNKFSIREIS